MDTNNSIFPLFSVYGIEIEYMIVDRDTLQIKPIADQVIHALSGNYDNEVERGEIAISNELALHLLEFKTNGPKPHLHLLPQQFSQEIRNMNRLLLPFNAQLLPSGMHPWYDPGDGIYLWPHGNRKIYESYNRIFNCNGHGFANVQSTHLNLPFSSDQEFTKLHNAIRLLLPIIPALTASTPFREGKPSGIANTRLSYYGKNQIKIPIIAGKIIPDFIANISSYHQEILQPIYQAIAPHDPEGILQEEWLNSRGAIARFDRHAIEIRIMDNQECPLADLVCASVIIAVCQHLINHHEEYLIRPLATDTLYHQYQHCVHQGMHAEIVEKDLQRQLGLSTKKSLTAHQLWEQLIEHSSASFDSVYISGIETVLSHGNLANRLLKGYQQHANLFTLYQKLAECLEENEFFIP